MNQSEIDVYYEKIQRRNELNRLRALIEGECGASKHLSQWNHEFAVHWQWFTDHRIALPEVNNRYDFTRTLLEREYEDQLQKQVFWDDLEAKLERKKADFLSTTRYLIGILQSAETVVRHDALDSLNSLGIIQGAGTKLDILAAEISQLHSLLKHRKKEQR